MAINFKKKNFAKSTLAAGISDSDTTATLATGDGAKFPPTGAGNTFRAVIWGAAFASPEMDSDREIVTAYVSASDDLAITRAQESTVAKAWTTGDYIALTHTAGVQDEVETEIAANASALTTHAALTATHGVSGAIVGTTDSQALSNKTLTTPTIASFTNATHSHQNSTGGGTLSTNALGSGTLGVNRGGTGLATWSSLGRLLYSTASTTLATLAGNTTTTKKFLSQTGDGSVSAAPSWETVSKADVGLSNVDNTSDATKDAATATLTNKTLTAPVINSPTGIVKGDVGLGNVDNTSDATKNAASVTLTNKTLTAPVINSPTGIVKGDVGLGNVDNTSDASKPVSTATQTALDLKADDSAVVHDTGNETIAGTKTFSSDVIVPDEAYDATAWNGSLEVPTKNALRDKIESMSGGGGATFTTALAVFGNENGQSTLGLGSNTVGRFWVVNVPYTIAVNKVTVSVNSRSADGPVKMALYSGDGTMKLWEETTATINADGNFTQTLSTTRTITPGQYIIGFMTTGSTNITFNSLTWINVGLSVIYNGTGFSEYVWCGELSGLAADTFPSTIDMTSITASGAKPLMRWDT